MTQLRAVIACLRRDALASAAAAFAAARARQPELAPHPDASSVLTTLADDREETLAARDALAAAILREHHLAPKGPWRSLLAVAFEPMIGRLRARIVSKLPADELDQTVLCAFLQAVQELAPRSLSHHVPIRLRQRTQRHVFRYLRKERHEEHDEVDVERLAAASEVAPPRQVDVADEADLHELLRRAWQIRLSATSKQVVQATVLEGKPLRRYVADLCPQDKARQEQLYQRLKRARSRALRRLRWFVEHPPAQLAFRF